MSATLLYHMHGIRGYTFLRQNIVPGGVEFFIAVPAPTSSPVPTADRRPFGKKEPNNDDSDPCPSEEKQPPSSSTSPESIATIAAKHNKSTSTLPKNINVGNRESVFLETLGRRGGFKQRLTTAFQDDIMATFDQYIILTLI